MQYVYMDAYLTIVASSAEGVEEGFLIDGTEAKPAFSLPLVSYAGQASQLSFYWPILSVQQEPLHRRAWTLQEVLLSPRLLVFGKTNVVWKCLRQAKESPTGTPTVLELG